MADKSKNVSSVYVWVTCKALQSNKAEDIIGLPSRKLISRKPEIVWWWQSDWRHDDDVSPSLTHFLIKDFPKIKNGLEILTKSYDARVEIDWVLGLGTDEFHGHWPIIELSPGTIAKLNDTGFTLQISVDDQVSATQLGLE